MIRTRWTNRLTLLVGCLLALLVIGAWRYHSFPPSDWTAVNIHEQRVRVIERLGASDSDQRSAKGFELWNSGESYFMAAKGRWQILIAYDGADHISRKEVRFTPYESDGYNVLIPPQLLYRIKTASVRRIE